MPSFDIDFYQVCEQINKWLSWGGGGGPSQGVWRGGPMRGLGSGHVTCGPMRGLEINFTEGTDKQTDKHRHGHRDSMTDLAQRAKSVKNIILDTFYIFFYKRDI